MFVRLGIALFCSVAFAVQSLADYSDVFTSCDQAETWRIESTHLSDQESDPFLFSGKLMDSSHPRWRQYRKALRRYPNVRNCLIDSEQLTETPNLLELDWQAVSLGPELDVCVFRVMRSLPSIPHIYAWLDFHGFKVTEFSRFVSESFVPDYDTQAVAFIAGNWSRDDLADVKNLWFENLIGMEISRGFSMNIQLSMDQVIVGAATSVRTK